MKLKSLIFAIALLLIPAALFGQGIVVPPQTVLAVVNGILHPVSKATITVCPALSSGIPCSPVLPGQLFHDAAFTQPLANPFNADTNGNYVFAIAPGTYTVTESGSGFAGYSYQLTVGGSGGSSASNYQTVQVNGAPVPQEKILNLINGTNMTVTCTDNAGIATNCTFTSSGSGGGGSGPTIQTDGINASNQSVLNFTSTPGSGITWSTVAGGIIEANVGGNIQVQAIQMNGALNDTGATNAFASCPGNPVPAQSQGLQVQFIASSSNSGPATYTFCSGAPVNIVRGGGSPLVKGDIIGNQLVSLEMTSSGTYQLINPSTVTGNVSVTSLTSPVMTDTGSAANIYAACTTGLSLTPSPGQEAKFTAAHGNTGTSTLALCGGTAFTIVKAGGSNIASGDILSSQTVDVVFTNLNTWQILNPSVIGGSGAVSGQVKGQPTVGCGANCIGTSAGAQLTSQQSGADLCTRISNAFNACTTTSACHVIIDEGGKQFCNTQPFQTSSGGNYAGFAEVWSNGTPLNLWLDGVSTIQHGGGFTFNGHGETGSSSGGNGGAANTNFVVCNPAVMDCPSGGFQEENDTIFSTAFASNVLTVNLTHATNFTTCQANGTCSNGGSNMPSKCDNGTTNATNGCVNMMAQYRLGCIYNSSVANNNGCFVYKTTGSFNGSGNSSHQQFQFFSQNGVSPCSSSCGTLYLDTPVIMDGSDNNGQGTYETEMREFNIEGQFMPGTIGFVMSQGEELTETHRIQVFNTTAAFWRMDQSAAYDGTLNGDTNSGPYGPFSGNFHNALCLKASGCSCSGSSGSCSGGNTPNGSSVYCSGGTKTTFAWLSPDPCLNPNFVGALYTGRGGNQGPDVVFHQTLSMSDLNGQSLPGPSGSGDHQGVGFGCFGSQCHFSQTHEEYFPIGFALCGDQAKNNMWYQAYGAIQTGGVILEGGLNGSNTNTYFDIGDANTNYASSNLCAGIHINMVYGGTGGGGTLTDNVTGHSMNLSTDAPIDYFIGTGNNPPVRTSQGNGGFSGTVSFPAGACAGALGGTSATSYGLPPYVKSTNSNACTITNLLGVPSPHACMVQNLEAAVGTTPSGTLTITVKDFTQPTHLMTCTIPNGQTSCQNTTMSANFAVAQGDLVGAFYSTTATGDTGTDVHVMWDCF